MESPKVCVPVPGTRNTIDVLTFTEETLEADKRSAVEMFQHWPAWALRALRGALDDLIAKAPRQNGHLRVHGPSPVPSSGSLPTTGKTPGTPSRRFSS